MVTWVVYLIYLAIVPIYFLYLALLYLLLPRPCSSWTLFQRIDTRFGKLQSTLLAWWLTPKSCVLSGKVEAWKIYPDEVQTGKLEIEIVSLQPIERKMVIRSLLDVRPTVRSRFTIIPKNHMYQPVTNARVLLHTHRGQVWSLSILYLTGLSGGYIRGIHYG